MHRFELVKKKAPRESAELDLSFEQGASQSSSRLNTEGGRSSNNLSSKSNPLRANLNLSQNREPEMQVKVTMITQVNLRLGLENSFAKELVDSSLKSALKNGVVEFYGAWT